MKKYKFLLLDADNTLLDFDAGERAAMQPTLRHFGVEPTPELLDIYSGLNCKYWAMYDNKLLTQAEALTQRFDELFSLLGRTCNSQAVEDFYRVQLGEQHILIDGARELLASLHKDYKLYLVTNGVASTQHSRLAASGIDKFFEGIFISEEVGFRKPEKEFFDHVFAQIPDFERSRTIIIGDSLTSDIAGGIAAGIDSCYYNPKGSANTSTTVPTYTVRSFSELLSLLEEK